MIYRYFAWRVSDGGWRGQKLLSSTQINVLVSQLAEYELFATIQEYDKEGNILRCPIYVDLDGEIERSLEDTRYLVWLIQDEFNFVPKIYYSGRKGFHVIIPHQIEGPDCHYIVQHFINSISKTIKSVDQRVYRPRAMFRLPNSRASRPGHFKVEVTFVELMNRGVDFFDGLSTTPRKLKTSKPDIVKFSESQTVDRLLSEAREACKLRANTLHIDAPKDLFWDITPCLTTMIKTPPTEGVRHDTIFILARFLKSCKLTEDEAVKFLLNEPHFQGLEENREVSRTVHSVYKSKSTSGVGCRKDTLMKRFCSGECKYNSDMPDLMVRR